MPLLKINLSDNDDCTPKRISVNGTKASNKGFKGYQFEIANSESVKIRILSTVQTRKEKLYFCFFAFLDITTSNLRDFLNKNSLTLQSEYEITLTDDAELEIAATPDGFIITEHSEACRILSESHKKENIPKGLLRMALAPIFILMAMLMTPILILGIVGWIRGNCGISITMFAIFLALALLFAFGLKQTFKK